MKPCIRLPFWALAVVFGMAAWSLLGSALALAVLAPSPLRDYAEDWLLLSAFLLFGTVAAGAAMVDQEMQS